MPAILVNAIGIGFDVIRRGNRRIKNLFGGGFGLDFVNVFGQPVNRLCQCLAQVPVVGSKTGSPSPNIHSTSEPHFRDPRFIEDERAQMFFGMDAGDAPGDERADHLFQPPAPEKHQRLGIDEQQLMRRRGAFVFVLRIFLQHELFKQPHGKTPEPFGVDELDEVWRRRNQFDQPVNCLGDSGCNFFLRLIKADD